LPSIRYGQFVREALLPWWRRHVADLPTIDVDFVAEIGVASAYISSHFSYELLEWTKRRDRAWPTQQVRCPTYYVIIAYQAALLTNLLDKIHSKSWPTVWMLASVEVLLCSRRESLLLKICIKHCFVYCVFTVSIS
jgi:hypothetical protein